MKIMRSLAAFLLFWLVFVNSQCNIALQTTDTFKLCKIFQETNVEIVYENWKLNDTNYCQLNAVNEPLRIICDNNTRQYVLELELLKNGNQRVSGELHTEYTFPSKLKLIKFKNYEWTYAFNYLNFSNILQENLEVLWFKRDNDASIGSFITGMSICTDIYG